MRASILLLFASLAACRTSSLGSCSSDADCASGAACDSVQRVCVATDAPQITTIEVATPPAFTDQSGRRFFDTAGTPLEVTAAITGPAGVDAATVCLRVTGEGAACAHPGTAGSGTFSFSLPRPSGTFDGTTPLEFTVSARSPSGRVTTSAPRQVFFDNQPPAISVAADSTPYARTLSGGGAAPIDVSVTITDPTGVASPQLVSGGASVAPSSTNGNVFVFQLDTRDAPQGTEGAYSFQVRATDGLGHTREVEAARVIDDAPPVISVQIFKDAPDAAAGVTYPAAVANTGWTGATFVYSDTVHVQGTITDLSGVGSATFHLDGLELDGGVSLGTSRPVGCEPGSVTCPFSLDVTLNDAGSEFHTGVSTFDAGPVAGFVPAGMLQFTIETEDKAAAFGGTASPRTASSGIPARTTRFLWQQTLAGAAVSGLAVHPNGDLIATMDGGALLPDGGFGDTVYALAPDQPVPPRWAKTLDATPPSRGVIGTPAIGAGDATTARIYVASSIGDVYALNPDGGLAWTNVTPTNNFTVGPAVTQVTIASVSMEEVVIPDGVPSANNARLWGARGPLPTDLTSVPSGNRNFHAAPVILGGSVYFATQNGNGNGTVRRRTIAADGSFASAPDGPSADIPFLGIVTDGARLYAATRPDSGAGILVKLDTDVSLPPLWSNTLTSGLSGEPTFGIDEKLYGAHLAGAVSTFDPANGSASPFASLGAAGMTPLQGSDGHVYIPRRTGVLVAFAGSQLSWTFDPPGTILRYATMDCSGRVFAASGATVFAFVSDDSGLADTPWPTLRRDSRNTGNAGALRYGMRRIEGCTQ